MVYSSLKPMMSTRCDILEAGPPRKILGLADISNILDGDADTPFESRPYSYCFREENLRSACSKVGMFPVFTRASQNDKRLRATQEDIVDVNGHAENPVAHKCAEVVSMHENLIAICRAKGYDVTDLAIVDRPKKRRQNLTKAASGSLADVISALKNCPQRLSPGVLQLVIGTKAMNSQEVLLGTLERFYTAAKSKRDSMVATRNKKNKALADCIGLEASFRVNTSDVEADALAFSLAVAKMSKDNLETLLKCRHGAGASLCACRLL